MDVALFGHSFVAHLERYMLRDPSRANLGLHGRQGVLDFQVRLKGLPGLKLEERDRLRRHEGFVSGAELCIVEIGTNDLADQNVDPLVFARKLCDYARHLQYDYHVRKVVISQVLFRRVKPYGSFNDHVIKANEEIARLCEQMPRVYFWRHHNVWSPSEEIYDMSGRYPGVHLNDAGNKRYLRSLKGAVLTVSRW